MTVRAIAFYLPQFHPIPENDRWWGKGFTEWRGVAAARPSFVGHYQPHIPADLGFYDLRVSETREAQVELARAYGIHGFCYYYYWFNGKRLLERPLDEVLASGRPDFPFCVCWANESWSRRWDGLDKDILIAQEYPDGWAERFIRDLLPLFRDSRYIRINGKPLLAVYRTGSIPRAAACVETWRDICRREGIGDIYLASVQSFDLADPRDIGFDAAIEFPPLGFKILTLDNRHLQLLDKSFQGTVHHYPTLVDWALQKPNPGYTWFRGVFPAWDNSPRIGRLARIFAENRPSEYQRWLTSMAEWSLREREDDEQLIFINAWNEWGEGAHLEPDLGNGHAYLKATRASLDAAQAAERRQLV